MAAVDYFLKVDGIEGESKDDKHKGEIDLESWSWGASQAGTSPGGGGGGAGKVSMQDFHFVMKVNKATPKLILACAKGDHIPQVGAHLSQGGRQSGGIPEVHLLGCVDLFLPDGRLGWFGYRADRADLL